MSADTHTRDRWRWLDQVAADPEVTPFAFKVAYVIASHVSRETGEAWPGQTRIAEKVGGTDRGVRNAIDVLQARGHLQVDRRQGRKDTNRYRMAIEYRNHGSGNGLEYRNGGSGLTGTAVPLIPLREPLEGDIYPPPGSEGEGVAPQRSASDANFAEFWSKAPLQRDEADTRRAYDRTIRTGRATHEQLMAGISRYATEREGEDPRFTKHPANWIRGGCWTDVQHAPSMLLPINGGKQGETSNGHVSSRSRSGSASAMSGIAAVRAKHMGADR